MGTKKETVRWMLYTGIIATVIMLCIYATLHVWPFGDGTMLTGDLNGQYINFYAQFRRALLGQGGFDYSFTKALGGSLPGLFIYYLSSPWNLLYVLFPTAASPIVAAFLLGAKLVAASVFFQLYIYKKYSNLGWYSVCLGLCYGFTAYNFAYAQNIMWHDVVMLLPLICLGLDRIVAGKSNYVYIASLGLAVFSNFYIAYMVCLFAVIYFVYSMFLHKKTRREYLGAGVQFAVGSVLAGGLSMVVLLPGIADISASKGDLLSYSFSTQTNFPLHSLPQQLLWGGFIWQDVVDGLPLIYCGLFVLLLVLCFFISRNITIKEKALAGGVVAILVLSFWIKGFEILWHGMKQAVWFPYRNSFILCFFLVLLAGTALAKNALGPKTLTAAVACVAAIAGYVFVYPSSFGRKKPLLGLLAIAAMAVALYIVRFSRKKIVPEKFFAFALTLVVGIELAAGGYYISNQFESYSLTGFQQFYTQSRQTMQAFAETQNTPYRAEKNFMRSFNDPMLIGNWGVSHFSSVQDSASEAVLYGLGYRNYGSNTYFYGSTAFADSLLGIRYMFSDGERTLPAHWQPSQLDTPYASYINPYALPLAFAVNQTDTAALDFNDKHNTFAYQNNMYKAVTGTDENILQPVTPDAWNAEGQRIEITGEMPAGFSYSITAPQDGYYYAHIMAPNNSLHHLIMFVNGESTEIYFGAENYGVINLGLRHENEKVVLSWSNTDNISIENAWFAFTKQEDLDTLYKQAWVFDGNIDWKDGRLQGNISALDNSTVLFTSIPFDKGWQAIVNGNKVEPIMLGNLMAVPLQLGENTVLIEYSAPQRIYGLIISLICIIVLAGIIVIRRIRKPKKMVNINVK